MSGARVLDLFAGSGALGIEALSRGAQHAVFVERAGSALASLRRNLDALELHGRTQLIAAPVERALTRLRGRGARFELILADPPYGGGRTWLRDPGRLAALLGPEGVLLVERDGRSQALEPAACLERVSSRSYGETAFDWLELPSPASASHQPNHPSEHEGRDR